MMHQEATHHDSWTVMLNTAVIAPHGMPRVARPRRSTNWTVSTALSYGTRSPLVAGKLVLRERTIFFGSYRCYSKNRLYKMRLFHSKPWSPEARVSHGISTTKFSTIAALQQLAVRDLRSYTTIQIVWDETESCHFPIDYRYHTGTTTKTGPMDSTTSSDGSKRVRTGQYRA